MAVKRAKTIAEYAIMKWLESENFQMEFFEFRMIGDCEAEITDQNSDTMILKYDKNNRMVSVV